MKKIIILLVVCATVFNANAQKRKSKKVQPKAASTQIQQKPDCLKQLIQQFSKEELQNPPRSIYSYTYKGKTVYYVTPPCCDFFSDLYDENCTLMGHPDGGFTGKGDMKMPDFNAEKKDEKLVWTDTRKQ